MPAWLSVCNDVQMICMVQVMPICPSHHLLLYINIQFGLAFLVPAYPGCPGKEAVKRVSLPGQPG